MWEKSTPTVGIKLKEKLPYEYQSFRLLTLLVQPYIIAQVHIITNIYSVKINMSF